MCEKPVSIDIFILEPHTYGDENMKSCDDAAQRPCFLASSPVLCGSVSIIERQCWIYSEYTYHSADQQTIEISENSDDGVQKPFFRARSAVLMWYLLTRVKMPLNKTFYRVKTETMEFSKKLGFLASSANADVACLDWSKDATE